MYIMFINGAYKGPHSLEETMAILQNTGYFNVTVAKPNSFSDPERVKEFLENLKIAVPTYLDSKHQWKIIRTNDQT